MRQFFLFFVSVLLTGTLFAQSGQCGFYISSSFDSECLSTTYDEYKPNLNHEESQCLLACSGSSVYYRVKGNYEGFTFEWQISGAESYTVNSSGLVVEVHWLDIVTEGSIILTGTDAQGNVCVEEICVELIEKPVASFTSNPPFYIENGTPQINVCDGQEIQFINTSTSSADAPIIGYLWSDNYHFYSTENFVFTADNSLYGSSTKISLEVQNECGCTDYFTAIVNIAKFPTLKVDCYGTACEGKEATYTVLDEACDLYLWTVEGGEIISGENSETVTVAWNNITDGYGYLGLDGTHCGQDVCPNLTYLPIPVIADSIPIEGPQVICAGEYYTFKLPIWASTHYNWNVYEADVINESGHPNELKIKVENTESFTIQCNYENEFLGCSGSATPLKVMVKDKVSITSESHTCQGNSIDFYTDYEEDNITQWQVYDEDMNLIGGGSTDNDPNTTTPEYFTYTFSDAGSYTIKAINSDFCEAPSKSVIVTPSPVIDMEEIANITQNWKNKVCANGGYLFSLPEVDDAYYVHWEAECGEPSSYDGLEYNVNFSGSICDIKVYYVDKLTGCKSAPYIHNLEEFTPDEIEWNIPDMICANSQFTVSAPEQEGVLYEWSVSNPMVASIAEGMYENTVTVQTNAVSQNFDLKLKRTYCDTDEETSVNINMESSVLPDFDLPSEICQYEVLTLSPTVANSVPGTWSWQIGNNNPIEGYTYQDTIRQEGTLPITLIYTNTCGQSYSMVKILYVNPAPYSIISTLTDDALTQITFTASTQDDAVGDFSYKWYHNGQYLGSDNPITVPYPQTLPALYICMMTNETTGCQKATNINITKEDNCIVDQGSIIADINCRTGVYTRTGYTTDLEWYISHKNALENIQISGVNNEIFSVTYNFAGYYKVMAWEMHDTCAYLAERIDTIPLVPKIQVDYTCSGTDMVQLELINASSILTDVMMDEPVWSINGTPVSNTVNKPNGTYIVNLEIGYTYMGQHNTCFTQDTIEVNRQNANFTISPPPYCEDVPITFNSEAENAMGYEWNFTQYNSSEPPILNLSNNPSLSPPYLGYNRVKLTVQDQMGCWANAQKYIQINQNTIEGTILDNDFEVCAGQVWELTYQGNIGTITQYDWSCLEWDIVPNNSPNYMATRTGTYQVNVQDNKGCVYQSPYTNICFKNTPTARIFGNDQYCQGENVVLNGYNGEHLYEWTFNGTVSEGANLTINDLSAGDYTVELKVTAIDNDDNPNNDCSETDVLHFQVHSKPSAPSIAFGNNKCIHQPPVDLISNSGNVYWNTGAFTNHIQTYTAGFHSAYRVDPQTGCRSSYTYKIVHPAPGLEELMTGCYTLCEDDLPKSILGISGTVEYYNWLLNGNSIQEGYNNTIPYLPILQLGVYNLGVKYPDDDSDIHCDMISEDLIINKGECYCNLNIFMKGKPECYIDGCNLIFSVDLVIENLSDNGQAALQYISMPNGQVYNVSPNMPIEIVPNGQVGINIGFVLNDYTPAIADFHLNFIQDKEPCIYNLTVDLSPYIEGCINKCGEVELNDFGLVPELSGESASRFKLVFELGSNLENVQIESELGQTYFPYYDSNEGYLTFLWGISNVELQAMAEANEEVCFHIYFCYKGKICKSKSCIAAKALWEIVQSQKSYMQRKPDDIENANGYSAENSQFTLYPNPANTMLNIEGSKLQGYAISNLSGQVLLEGSEKAIDIQSLAKGTYLIRLIDANNKVSYLKFVKQ